MNDPGSSPLYIAERAAAVPVPRAVEKAYLWAVAALGGAAAGALLIFAVATQSSTDAERIVSAGSPLDALVGAFAASQGRKAY
ncbi:hypothetical protein [Methylobacterium sp. A54F]